MHTKHLSLARKFATARASANERIEIVMSLHAYCSAKGCPCTRGMDEITELGYLGYQRQKITLELEAWGGAEGGARMRNYDDIHFPPYTGAHPAVVTHVTLWDTNRSRKTTVELARSMIMKPKEVATFPCGSVKVIETTHWVSA